MKYTYKILLLLFIAVIFAACSKNNDNDIVIEEKSINIAIMTDVHIYDISQGYESNAFKNAELGEIKMFELSEAILKQATNEIISYAPDVVLICGDLTKDGGIENHTLCRSYLQQLKNSGSKVYVVPGNHDIGGGREVAYNDDETTSPVDVMMYVEFADFYSDFGYGDAIARDPNSLSYIVEPIDGLWIMGIDACNTTGRFPALSWIDGEISGAGKTWIMDKLAEARDKEIEVIGFLHHGVIEHFPNQELIFDEYLISDWKNIAEELANAGLHVVFTGHNHASDISTITSPDTEERIFDIQTNATISWNSTWREINYDITGRTMRTKVHPVTNVDYDLPNGDFVEYSKEFNDLATNSAASYMLEKFQLSEDAIEKLLPLVTETLTAYRQGDEKSLMTPEIQTLLDEAKEYATSSTDPVANLLISVIEQIWLDPTLDNDTSIEF